MADRGITIRDALAAIAQLIPTYEYAHQLTQDVGGYQMQYNQSTHEWIIHPAQPDQIRRYTMSREEERDHVATLRNAEERLLRVCLLPYISSDMTALALERMCQNENSAHHEFWETLIGDNEKYWRRVGVDESLPEKAIFALDRVQSWWRRGPQVQY